MPDEDTRSKRRARRTNRRPGVSRYQLKLPDDLVDRLDELAEEETDAGGFPIARSHQVEEAIREYLERRGRL